MTSQALNRPVDVLAVLDREIAAIQNTKQMVDFAMGADRQAAYADHLSSLTEARAAVAKLIEATRDLIEFAEPILTAIGFGYVGRIEKARKALAAIGGAK